jgi:cobalamin biosynthesis Mg chelatase CobN
MRKWVSALAVVAGLLFAEPASADSPATVYSDFAEDGVLSCCHSRSALRGVLNDASLHQYGDPLTFIQLKLAIRKQLAGGCRRRVASRPRNDTGTAAGEPTYGERIGTQSASPKPKERSTPSDHSTRQAAEEGSTSRAGDSKESGGMVLVGVALLLLALGSGGWAARRAFGPRE